LSKPLPDSQRLTEEDRDATFWYSFHPDDRRTLTGRLIAKYPYQPEGQAFNVQDVFRVTRMVFTGQQYFSSQQQNQWEEPAGRKA
jgi:hypothetical protein